MARTAITPIALGTKDTFTAVTYTTVDATLVSNGAVVTEGLDGRLLIYVKQTDATARAITIQSAPEYGDQFDLVKSIAQNGEWVTTIENAKYVRGFGEESASTDNGKLYIDFATGFTGTITIYALNSK